MCVLGMAEEFKGEIAVNALWPKTGMYLQKIHLLDSHLLSLTLFAGWGGVRVSRLSKVTSVCLLGKKFNFLLCIKGPFQSPLALT